MSGDSRTSNNGQISFNQPGPPGTTVQCVVKRDRKTSSYQLHLALPPTFMEEGKFLLAARKFRSWSSTDYIISLNADNISRGGSTYVVGKVRSDLFRTKFTIYDSQLPGSGAVSAANRNGRRTSSSKIFPRVYEGSHNVDRIAYELNFPAGAWAPRRLQCDLNTIPASAMEPDGSALTPTEIFPSRFSIQEDSISYTGLLSSPRSKSAAADSSALLLGKDGPLVLKSKAPRWHYQRHSSELNFRGRVTVESVKNFQLVVATEPSSQMSGAQTDDHDKVLLQFGKVGRDTFTMDYRYPLSAFQAFAICLSSFDISLACN